MAELLTSAMVKTRLGLESDDDTYDAAIAAALPLVTEWFESYCDRGLAQRTITDEAVYNVHSRRIYLWAFPISSVSGVKVDGIAVDGASYEIAPYAGYIYPGTTRPTIEHAECLKVSYTGGYAQASVPVDLAQAFAVAVGVQAQVANVSSAASGSSAIKSIGLGGGALSVAFDTSQSQGGISGSYSVDNVPVEVQNYASVLSRYMRHGV